MRPAAVSRRFFGAYQGRKQSSRAARVKRRAVARVPRIGAPSEWPRQKFLVSNSCATDSGLSSSMRISSRITWRSLTMSCFGKERAQRQVGDHVKGQREMFVQHLGVEADGFLRGEGIEHAADRVHLRAICSAVRRAVPLNTMCSMKWAMPLSCWGSEREPERTQMPMETECACGMGSAITAKPFGSTSRAMVDAAGCLLSS